LTASEKCSWDEGCSTAGGCASYIRATGEPSRSQANSVIVAQPHVLVAIAAMQPKATSERSSDHRLQFSCEWRPVRNCITCKPRAATSHKPATLSLARLTNHAPAGRPASFSCAESWHGQPVRLSGPEQTRATAALGAPAGCSSASKDTKNSRYTKWLSMRRGSSFHILEHWATINHRVSPVCNMSGIG